MPERVTTEYAQLLETVTFDLELRDIDIGALIDSVIAGIPSHERGRIKHDYPRPVIARGDEARLRFGIANLLTMMLACCIPGSWVTLRTTRYGRRATITALAGCRPREHEWVAFDLMRKITDAHGGSASAAILEDAVRICIELPAARRSARSWGTDVHVLLVDDSLQQVITLSEVLRGDGLRVEFATSGHEALARASERCPDVLVLDMQLPDLSATDVIEHARAYAPNLPVVLLTGYPADHAAVAKVLASTRSTYLAKPVNVDALLELIADAVGNKSARRE
jgi:CheY-like chemotaxis protein